MPNTQESTNYVKNIYTEIYNYNRKKRKGHEEMKNIIWLCIARINLIKLSIQPKTLYRCDILYIILYIMLYIDYI